MPDPILEAIVQGRLGAAPQPAGAPAQNPAAAAAAAAQPQQPPAPPKASDAPTDQEKATAKVAPNDAGSEASFEFIEIEDGGSKRQLTKQQIAQTLSRYRDLNYKWSQDVAPIKPVLDVVKNMMAAAKQGGHDPKGEEVAQLIDAAVKAYLKNPQMGGDGKKVSGDAGDGKAAQPAMSDDDDGLEKWAKENAVSVPPGLKEQAKTVRELNAKIDQLMQLLMAQQGGQQMAVGAQQMVQQAQMGQAEAMRTMVKANIQGAMQAAQLTPQDGPDFMAFAQARGYSPEDFLDAELTRTVVNDFKANRDAPEIQRLREVIQRRQAFTGSADAAPGGAAAAANGGADPMFAKLVQQTMARKQL